LIDRLGQLRACRLLFMRGSSILTAVIGNELDRVDG
jgi:hypothetical protein